MLIRIYKTKIVILLASVAVLSACTNRPVADRWKYGTAVAQVEATPMEYIYVPSAEADGSLNSAEIRKLNIFLNNTGFKRGDQILVQTSATYKGESAGEWISYWLKGQNLTNQVQVGLLDLGLNTNEEIAEEDRPAVQLVVRRYRLSVPNCAQNMADNISSVASVTKRSHGCANQANFAHMIANPAHLIEGSDPGMLDGTTAARGVNNYWKGEKKSLSVDQFDALSNSSGEGS